MRFFTVCVRMYSGADGCPWLQTYTVHKILFVQVRVCVLCVFCVYVTVCMCLCMDVSVCVSVYVCMAV